MCHFVHTCAGTKAATSASVRWGQQPGTPLHGCPWFTESIITGNPCRPPTSQLGQMCPYLDAAMHRMTGKIQAGILAGHPHLQPELILSSMRQILGPVSGFPALVDVRKALQTSDGLGEDRILLIWATQRACFQHSWAIQSATYIAQSSAAQLVDHLAVSKGSPLRPAALHRLGQAAASVLCTPRWVFLLSQVAPATVAAAMRKRCSQASPGQAFSPLSRAWPTAYTAPVCADWPVQAEVIRMRT